MNERLLVREQILDCERCELHTKATTPIPFSGPTPAQIAIVGEAPGKDEDVKGEPFIGRAGQLLRKLLTEAKIKPEDCFICNTASCYPGDIKTPQESHIAACRVNKLAQLDLAEPQYVLILGGVALSGFRPDLKISKVRGRAFKPAGQEFIAFATYHPAAALRNRLYERELGEDLKTFRTITEGNGNDEWHKLIGDHCVECRDYWSWIDDDGFPWCDRHAPPAFNERMTLLKQELVAARARS